MFEVIYIGARISGEYEGRHVTYFLDSWFCLVINYNYRRILNAPNPAAGHH